MELVKTTKTDLTSRERDYLLVTIFVLAQHGHYERARTLIDGMLALGDETAEVVLGQAVLAFFCDDAATTIRCLDRLDAMEKDGSAISSSETGRMRTYLRARCYFSNGREVEAQEIAAKLAAKPIKPKSDGK